MEFRNAKEPHGDEVEQARRDFVRWRQSLGGRAEDFSFTRHRVRRGMADMVSAYLSAIDEQLPMIVERLRSVQIVCRPALEVIRYWDGPDSLFYCDPPYLPSTRAEGGREVYAVEMSEGDHCALGDELHRCRGKVVVSGYPSSLYEELYRAWRVVEVEIANHATGAPEKRRMKECLWMNWQE